MSTLTEAEKLTESQNTSKCISDSCFSTTLSSQKELSEAELNMLRDQTLVKAKNVFEFSNWLERIPLDEYPINKDSDPDIIRKKPTKYISYIQELAVRYLKPVTPPPPGNIVIRQEKCKLTPPAPPLIIRHQPPRPKTPEPIVIREEPPNPPRYTTKKIIKISGKRLPPPPRKVVIERLPKLPQKPTPVIIERWLPYSQVKRKVVYQKLPESNQIYAKPKNVIIQWESPKVDIKKDLKYLGIKKADPVDYVKKYGAFIKSSNFSQEFEKIEQNRKNQEHELEGDVDALKLIDLEKEGLGKYREQVENFNSNRPIYSARYHNLSKISAIFSECKNSCLTLKEAEWLLFKLNLSLNREYEPEGFFLQIERNNDGTIGLNEFKRCFIRNL